MASGRELYDACCGFLGEPYSTDPGRTDPNSGYKDCSGMVAAGFEACQGYELGAYVTTTIFEQSVIAGLEIPYYAAENIVGALIFKPENPYAGWGPNGHIAVSDGYGGTVEATPPRVQRLPLSYNAPWSSHAALAIDIDYSNYGEGTPVVEMSKPKEDLMNPVLFHDPAAQKVFVYDPNNHTKTQVSDLKSLGAVIRWWDIYRYANGGQGAASNIISTDDPNPEVASLVKDLLNDAADVRAFDDVSPAGSSDPLSKEEIDRLVKAINDDAAERMRG